MAYYRTRTYLAADWDNDKDAIDKLREWNDSPNWRLDFTDAHDLTQSNDSSLNCTIKASLGFRMNHSKTFVLIVGAKTKSLRAGSCIYCKHYDWNKHGCSNDRSTSFKSFIEYECDKAVRDGLKIVVIYNYSFVDRSKCPEVVKSEGKHVAAYHWDGYAKKWNYSEIRDAIMD